MLLQFGKKNMSKDFFKNGRFHHLPTPNRQRIFIKNGKMLTRQKYVKRFDEKFTANRQRTEVRDLLRRLVNAFSGY
jgi:hypothetical protein